MNVDRTLTEIIFEFDSKFRVYESILMMESTTGIRPRFITIGNKIAEEYFYGHKIFTIYGCHVEIDPFCPYGMVYYSDEPFDASREK